MTDIDPIEELKSVARKIARTRDIKHVGALEIVAKSVGFPHWNALTVAHKKGWRPTLKEQATANALLPAPGQGISIDTVSLPPVDDEEPTGEIQGQAYRVSDYLDDVVVEGRGWKVVLPEAPLAPPKYLVTDRRLKSNPITDPAFRDHVLVIGQRFRKRVHDRIAADWPTRSTVPDSAGMAEHPLGHGVGDTWWCLHCDQPFTSKQITANLFHCPNCLASPLDIHTSPWWLGQGQGSALTT